MYKRILYILISFLVLSCSHEEKHGNPHGGHDHEEMLNYTLFSDQSELFATFSPLVVGQTSEFITHLTQLANYKPKENTKLTVSLIKAGKGIRHSVNESDSPGIYRAFLQPKEAGKFTLVFELSSQGNREKFSVDSIEVYASHGDLHNHSETKKSGNEISFLKEQAWKTDFAIKQIKRKNFREVINTSGQLLPANGDEISLVAPYTGLVILGKSAVEGVEVSRGEILLTLSGEGIASDNVTLHSLEIKSNYKLAKANYERLQKLVGDKIVSQKEFLEAKTKYEQAKAAYDNLGFSGNGKQTLITSTLSGFVKDVNVSDGQYVEAGTSLVTIVQNKKLILQADVAQNHWHCLPEIEEANFITPYESTVFNTKELNGKLISYGKNASKSAWSVPVHFEISNLGDLIPGTFVEAYLLSKPIPNVLAVPKSSLIEEQGHFYVFIQLNGECYEKRKVTTGIDNGDEIEILSGLSNGDIIVTRGAYQVKLASMSSALPAHGHEH